MNIKKILKKAENYLKKHEIPEARLDSEVLLADILDMERIKLYVNYDYPLTEDELNQYRHHLKERAQRVPVAYITGHKEFMSLDFEVNNQVLVPRPETELLVEEVISICRDDYEGAEEKAINIVDVGTGSGAIMVSLGYHLKQAKILGIDISEDSLKIARKNIEKFNLESRLKVVKGDLLQPLIKRNKSNVDIVVSNPPYIKKEEMEQLPPEVKKEPRRALDGGQGGINYIKKIISQSLQVLNNNGFLFLEIGYDQARAVKNILNNKWKDVKVKKDYSNQDRVVIAQKNSS